MGIVKSADSGDMQSLRQIDPEIAAAIEAEQHRQQEHLVLIASENLVSKAVLEAQASVLTNKYAEGYPGARYYGGCAHVDSTEQLARCRATALFGADHANVQPHSGASANLAAYLAFLNPGDRILGMNLAHGGHLTHGSKVSISGKHFEAHSYGVDRSSGLLDLEAVREAALSVRPKLIIAGASAYPRLIDYAGFKKIAQEAGAFLMVDMAHVAGLVAAGVHPNPVPWSDVVTSTTHKTLRGPRGGLILCRRKHAQAIDKAIFPGLQGGPLMHVIAAKAVALLEARTPGFVTYQQSTLSNAAALAAALSARGFELVTGGTDNHMVLLDLRNKQITGRDAEVLLDRVGITVNKNAIPYDPRGPVVTSGLRLGTPTVTSRGMGPEQLAMIADMVDQAFVYRHSDADLTRIKRQVSELCSQFPIEYF
jgi:glycine hydroxymethyltransferase